MKIVPVHFIDTGLKQQLEFLVNRFVDEPTNQHLIDVEAHWMGIVKNQGMPGFMIRTRVVSLITGQTREQLLSQCPGVFKVCQHRSAASV